MADLKTRKLVLSDGSVFLGTPFGAETESLCEVVFNTSMVGYQEIVSDPSYMGQTVVMTYPLIGNYGMTIDDYESWKPWVGGLIVRDYNDEPSNFRHAKNLGDVLEESGIPGISGVDTRKITRIIRSREHTAALITSADTPHEVCMEKLNSYALPSGNAGEASRKKLWYSRAVRPMLSAAVIDCGIKSNIVRRLNERHCDVTLFPYGASADEVLAAKPDGLFLSNGPGDPAKSVELIELVRQLRGKLPIYGICLGHQIIALAYGGKTEKMKFGHRGSNHPVRNIDTNLVEMTSQNHGFCVIPESLEGTGLRVTHVNILDGSVEGIECARDNVLSVQFHPESAPGPQDSARFFDLFIKAMAAGKEK